MSYRSDDEYREMIFNEWFNKTSKTYEFMRDGKCCDIGIDIAYPPFINTFNKAYRGNMREYDSIEDCYGDCVALVWEGMLKFQIKDGSSWEAIATKKDMSNYKRLVHFLKTHVTNNIKRMKGEWGETSKWVGSGKNRHILHIFYNISPESLNQITTFDNSLEKVELVDTVTNSYWEGNYQYKYDMFMEWARRNIKDCITKSQYEFIERLQEANYSSLDRDYDKSIVGDDKHVLAKLERIRNKVTARYYSEQKYFSGGYILQNIDNELRTFGKYLARLDDEEHDVTDEQVTQLILSSMNNPYWERLIYEDLSDSDQKAIIKVYQDDTVIYEDNFKLFNAKSKLDKQVLYRVTNAVVRRVKILTMVLSYELELLHEEATKNNVNVPHIQYDIPDNISIVYLDLNAHGLMLQK